MSAFHFEESGNAIAVRDDLSLAHEAAWAAIGAPGTWLTGTQRVAVAAEIRHARGCAHCARIKAALSPHAVAGDHAGLGALGTLEAGAVELIHRVVSDPGRLSERWTQEVLARGLSEGEYGEYFELTKIFGLYMKIFGNQQFNQDVEKLSLTYIDKLLKVFTDKRAKDYQDVKRFVSTQFVDFNFLTDKEVVELFKTRRKRRF